VRVQNAPPPNAAGRLFFAVPELTRNASVLVFCEMPFSIHARSCSRGAHAHKGLAMPRGRCFFGRWGPATGSGAGLFRVLFLAASLDAQSAESWAMPDPTRQRAAPNKIQFNGVGGGLRTYIRCMRIGDQPSR
jgi:hypothetical protein